MQFEKNNIASEAEKAELLRELVEESSPTYQIPGAAFENYHIKRGLREPDGTGVMAGVTRVCNAHGYVINEGERTPVDGELFYRGYRMSTLCDNFVRENRFGFAECCYLLFFGHLPTKEQLERFSRLVSSFENLPARFDEDILMKAPSRSIMNKMATGVLSLYAYDDNPDETTLENLLRQSIQLIARVPVIAAHAYAVNRNVFEGRSLNLHNPHPELTTAENFLRMMRSDKTYTDEEAKLLDLCLVVHAEHGGGNNSSFTTHVVTSAGSDTYSTITAALCSLKGPRHGGANIKVMEMMADIKKHVTDWNDDDAIRAHLSKLLAGEAYDKSGLIYGMGHAVYSVSDPRAKVFKGFVEQLASEKGRKKEFKLYDKIERISQELICQKRKVIKGVSANVDFYSGFVYNMLGLPVELFTPMFAVARMSGWSAHRLEELYNNGKIIRPAYVSTNGRNPYVELDKRN